MCRIRNAVENLNSLSSLFIKSKSWIFAGVLHWARLSYSWQISGACELYKTAAIQSISLQFMLLAKCLIITLFSSYKPERRIRLCGQAGKALSICGGNRSMAAGGERGPSGPVVWVPLWPGTGQGCLCHQPHCGDCNQRRLWNVRYRRRP